MAQVLPTTSALEALRTRWLEGDNSARDMLLEQSQERIRRIVRRELNMNFLDLKNNTGVVTEEVQQEVNVAILQWIQESHFSTPETLRAYFAAVRTVASRTLCNLARRFNVPGRRLSGGDTIDELPDRPTTNDDRLARVWELVSELPEELREIFELRYWFEMKLEDIVEVVGTSAPTVLRKLREAEKIIRQKFNPDNFGNQSSP
jgi:RNA polymerase sigma factor (sigma-70 family)